MTTIITGQNLRIVRNTGTAIVDRPDKRHPERTIIGKPVTITGAVGTLVKYTSVAPDLVTAILAESDPHKRAMMLTNVVGTRLDGPRSAVRRDVMDALTASHIAAVATDPANPTDDERRAARARLQGYLTAGLVVLPSGDNESDDDALAWLFGVADEDTSDDDDDTTSDAAAK